MEDKKQETSNTDTVSDTHLQVKEVMDLLPPLHLSTDINPNFPNIPAVIVQ